MVELIKYNRSGGADGATCVKCGAADPTKRWHAPDFACAHGGTEHMHLTCQPCGYEWPTKPMDAQ